MIIPAEGTYTDAELEWIDAEPPGLFPDQQSIWGQARKTFADYVQSNLSDKLNQLRLDLDPATADLDGIADWERMLLIPVDTTKSLSQRRAFVQSRRIRGAFTKTRRKNVVELFIAATLGVPTFDLSADGTPLTSDGHTLGDGISESDITSLYEITQNVAAFSYHVYILNTVGEDTDGLTRELERITPAPITFTITHPSSLP